MKHRKKPGAMPCHSATKASVMKWEMSLFPRNRSLLYRYLREKRISLAEIMAISSFFLPSSPITLELTDLHGLLHTNDRQLLARPKGTHICFLRATRGARNPNFQVVFTHSSHVCSQHSFILVPRAQRSALHRKAEWLWGRELHSSGLPLRMNGMHKMQFDHACLDLLSPVIWSRVFWLSVTLNLHKAQRWSKSILTLIVVALTP